MWENERGLLQEKAIGGIAGIRSPAILALDDILVIQVWIVSGKRQLETAFAELLAVATAGVAACSRKNWLDVIQETDCAIAC
jgi:hypothetical protein